MALISSIMANAENICPLTGQTCDEVDGNGAYCADYPNKCLYGHKMHGFRIGFIKRALGRLAPSSDTKPGKPGHVKHPVIKPGRNYLNN